ncbi:MAG: amino acid synthesis family protein [Phycisphaerales bacterium]
MHPTFGAPVRAAIGGGAAIIPSTKVVAAAGFRLTMPVTNRHDIWVFDDMDSASFAIDDAPRPDEIVVALVYATGGRPGHRITKPS